MTTIFNCGSISTEMAAQVSVRISKEVQEKLDKMRHPGQSYDGVLREILMELEEWRRKSPESATTK